MRADEQSGFYRSSRRLAPRRYRLRVALFAALAALFPTLAAVGLLATAPPAAEAAAILAAAGLAAAACVAAVAALLAPVERLGAALRGFAEGSGRAVPADDDAVGQIARGVEALSRRLEAASRRADPTRLDDPLTGLPNRLAAMRRGRDEIIRARRGGAPLAAAVLAFRDPEGGDPSSSRGEAAFRLAAEAMVQTLRAYDVTARWDGARFAAILPEAEIEHAVAALRRATAAVGDTLSRQGYGAGYALCAGVAVLQPDDATLADIAVRAEAALARALAGGGVDGVEAAPGPRTRPAQLTSV